MESEDIIIDVENISKRYRIGVKEEKADNLVTAMWKILKSPITNFKKYRSLYKFKDLDAKEKNFEFGKESDIIWALKNVSFKIRRGELFGIIGGNGAGKSTLLKILSRVTDPTSGNAKIYGRVSSLLEVGTGFHPELTGRDNIYLNGTILGMRKKEIDSKFDEIVDFSEIGKFLDTPVKRYSSGMRVRLAFSVAAHLEPEILIVDEVLAVGDSRFQKKCLGKMGNVAKRGKTVLFVSHNMAMISELCNKCILLNDGRVENIGETREIIRKYISSGLTFGKIDLRNWEVDRRFKGPMRILYLSIEDFKKRIKSQFSYGESIFFRIGISARAGSECIVGLSIRDPLGHLVLHFSNIDDKKDLKFSSAEAEVCVCLKNNFLNDGDYYVTVFLGDGFNIENDYVYNCLIFNVNSATEGRIVCNSPIRLPAVWEMNKIDGLVKSHSILSC